LIQAIEKVKIRQTVISRYCWLGLFFDPSSIHY
jgi:hypothetical protein